jgi:DNA topoisomerase-1
MPDARGSTVTARLTATSSVGPGPSGRLSGEAQETDWTASGRTIAFPGWLAVYGYGGEDDADEAGDQTAKLPGLVVGAELPVPVIDAAGHATQPPPRYTEATLVKALEERGIGRPSTYASIMSTIQERGYVWRKGQALVPTTDAFAVVKLLEGHFGPLIDYDFTARMEDDLDEIAGRRKDRLTYLDEFWNGNGSPGLDMLRNEALKAADPVLINAVVTFEVDGERIELRNGKFGPFLKRGDETRSIPDDLPLDELTAEVAVALLDAPKGDEPIGTDPETGLPVFARNGRFGPYVQLGTADNPPPGESKPKMASLFKDMTLETITLEDALKLLSLPRVVGTHPDGGEIVAANGRYGPFLSWGKETRSLASEDQLFTVTLEEAVAVLAQPKTYGRRQSAPAAPLREFPPDPVSGTPIQLKEGRFGPYVTDGVDNQSLKKGDTVESITWERAVDLLAQRREYLAANPAARKKAGAKKATAKKKAAPKKAAPKKPAAKKKT